MRTRTLILAAQPLPFDSVWVELEAGSEWECRVIGEPDEPPHGALVLDVVSPFNAYTVVLDGCKTIITGGVRVRAKIVSAYSDRGHVTVLMEARNGLHDGR